MSLVVENVTVELGDGDQKVRALDDVSATVHPGELAAVLVSLRDHGIGQHHEDGSRRE